MKIRTLWPWVYCVCVATLDVGADDHTSLRNQVQGFQSWVRTALLGETPATPKTAIGLELRRQDYGKLGIRQSCIETPMQIGQKRFEHGLGSHSVSEIAVHLPEPATRFEAEIGIDNDRNTFGREGTVVFVIEAGGKELYRSAVRRGSDPALPIRVELEGRRAFTLRVLDGDDGPSCDHGDWADAAVVTASGKRQYLDELPLQHADVSLASTPPFTFQYGERHSRELLAGWKRTVEHRTPSDGRQPSVVTYTDPVTKLEVVSEVTLYDELPAAEWMLVLRNAGNQDTPILEIIQPLDLLLDVAQGGEIVLHYANGSTCSPTGYQFHREDLDEGLVLVFRREKSAYAAVDVKLRGLQPKQSYELTYADGGPSRRITGEDLAHRLRVAIDRCPGSVLIRYRSAATGEQ